MSVEKQMSKRLKTIVELAEPCTTVLDIGTDHAYVPLAMLEQGKATYAIASDLREGPCARARANGERYGMTERLSVRLGSGFDTVAKGEADTVVLAGMGGILICDILTAARENDKLTGRETFLLQAMTDADKVRRYLPRMGYRIEKEVICQDGKFYTVMLAKSGRTEVQDEFEFEISRPMRDDPLLKDYVAYKLEVCRKVQAGRQKSRQQTAADGELARYIEKYEKLLEGRI